MVLLDPTAPVEALFGGAVELSEVTVHQQAAVDDQTGDVYVTQVVEGGRVLPGESGPSTHAQRAARGDLAISRVSPSGMLLGVMYCRGFDHGAALSVERDGGGVWLWSAYDAAEVPEGSNAHGRRVARYRFQDGSVLDVGDSGIQAWDPVPGARTVLPSLDVAAGRIAVQYAMPGQPRRYVVWPLGEFKGGNFTNALYSFDMDVTDLFQSYVLYDRYVYQSHGRGYSASNPPPGNSTFVIVDITTGRTVRVADNRQQPGLDHREPEALSVFGGPAAPRMLIGFATGDVGARVMRLYGTVADAGPGTWISTVAVEGEGVSLTVSVPDRANLRSWAIVRQPSGTLLFDGTASELPSGIAQFLDTGPPPCQTMRYELRLDYTNRQEDEQSTELTWVPPGGCGGGGNGGPVATDENTLGCAESYSARIHWRGGAQEYPVALMDRVTSVTWSRTLNDISTAEVVAAKGDIQCCERVEDLHDWVHELTIYRHVRGNVEVVWQGPVLKVRARRDRVIFEAVDVVAWLERLVNTYWVHYITTDPDAKGRRIGTIVYIALNHLRLNLVESSLSVPPDYPEIMDYVVARDEGLPVIRVEKDGSANDAIWRETLADIFREWTKRGLTFTTIGRSLVLRGFPNQQTLPQARLAMSDFLGDEVEVLRDGTQTATYAFATTQREPDISGGRTIGWGYTGTAYGRLDTLVQVDDDGGSDAETDQILLEAAQTEIAGRFPTPLVIQVPDNAQVSPNARVRLEMLVPGERFDVFGDDFCFNIAQGFALADVEGKWENGREQISLGLVPLDDVQEGGEVPPDDNPGG